MRDEGTLRSSHRPTASSRQHTAPGVEHPWASAHCVAEAVGGRQRPSAPAGQSQRQPEVLEQKLKALLRRSGQSQTNLGRLSRPFDQPTDRNGPNTARTSLSKDVEALIRMKQASGNQPGAGRRRRERSTLQH